MTFAATKSDAESFGHNHLPEFCGESLEIEIEAQAEAEEFWGVRTIHVVNVKLDPTVQPNSEFTASQIWVHGPELPEDVEADGLLTPEDRRDLTLDHIARTCEVVVQMQIRKWA